MHTLETGLAVLIALTTVATAQLVYTVTEYPNTCSAIYTSGTQTVTVVQSTVTTLATPSPFGEAAANSGTPFVLEIDQPTPFGSKRQTGTRYWVKSDGNTTSDGTQAAQYIINAGQLQLLIGGFYSTSSGVSSQPFAAATTLGPINSTFSVSSGALTWSNAAFANDGAAQFFKTPAALVVNAQVIVSFTYENGNTPASWAPIKLTARALSDVIPATSTLASSTVITSVLGFSSMPVFTFAPSAATSSPPFSSSQSLPAPYSSTGVAQSSSTPALSSTTSLLPMTLSTVSAPGVPIGPNRPSGLSINATATSTDSGSLSISTAMLSSPMSTMSSSTTVFNTVTGAPSTSTITLMAISSSSALSTSSISVVSLPYSSSATSSSLATTTTLTSTTTTLTSRTTSIFTTITPLLSLTSSGGASTTAVVSSTTSVISPYIFTTSSSSLSSSSAQGITTSPAQSTTSSTGTSTTSSSSTSTRTWAASTYSCPAVNGATVNDNWGVAYIIGCGQDTTDGNYDSQTAANSWDDCFWRCHNSSTTQGVGKCTAFTYLGGTNGIGSGTCFLKDQAGISFSGSGSGLVGAIQVAYYAAASSSSQVSSIAATSTVPSLVSSTTSSLAISSSSTSSLATSFSSTSSLAASSSSTSSSSGPSSSSPSSSSSIMPTITTTTTASSSSSRSSSSPTTTTTTTTTTMTTTTTSTTTSSSSLKFSSSTTSTSSSSSAYLVLASPTPCNFGDPAGTDEDDSYCEIDLPFQMKMYSVSAPQTFASTNGYISMINGSSQYQVNPLPFSGLPSTTIAPLFDDLYIYGGAKPAQGIFYQIDSSSVTYEYYLGRANGSTLINHFTVRYSTANPGIFTYNYISVPGNGNTSCVGSQGLNSNGAAIAAQFSYQSAVITSGSTVICNTNTNSCQQG